MQARLRLQDGRAGLRPDREDVAGERLHRGLKGEARIRTQMSAAHTREQLEFAVNAFQRAGRKVGVIS